MKKFRLLTILLMTGLMMFATACSSEKEADPVTQPDQQEVKQEELQQHEIYADEEFIEDLVNALVSRWDYMPDFEYEPGSDAHLEYFTTLVQIERDILSKYKDEKFENDKLNALAISYIDGLDRQDDALEYLLSDYDHYRSLWNDARNQRAICIKNIYDEVSGFEVPAAYEDGLYHMITSAYIAQNYDAVDALFNTPVQNGEYKREGSTLTVSILNTTDFEFRNFTIYADLYNNGTYAGWALLDVDSWKPGEVHDFVFDCDPNINFDSFEITLD